MNMIKCISNKNYPASLTIGKTYLVIEDEAATLHNRIRIVDDTNESYLYPLDLFEIVKK